MEMTGNELKERRERLGFSQQELALKLNNLAVSTVARWEQLKDGEITNNLLELALKTVERENPVFDKKVRDEAFKKLKDNM